LYHADGLIPVGNIPWQIPTIRQHVSSRTPIEITSMDGEERKKQQLGRDIKPIAAIP